jgi:hypothetical protein
MKNALVSIVVLFLCANAIANHPTNIESMIKQKELETIIAELKSKAAADQHARIEKGVVQAASFWRAEDGSADDFKQLCMEQSAVDAAQRQAMFVRIQDNFELLFGSFNKVNVGLKIPLHVDEGEILPIDRIFGGYGVGSHFSDDMFANKIAFITILNFPFFSLDEKMEHGPKWSRLEWAYARMGDVFKSRIPARLLLDYEQIVTNADAYISDYNIYVGNLTDKKGNTHFPTDLKLISHWGLRDEIKANYANKEGFIRQSLIYETMLNIIRQNIPGEVINNPDYQWNPMSNTLLKNGVAVAHTPEPDTRYQHMINLFGLLKLIDAYSPHFPDYISRKFEEDMELRVEEVESLFVSLISTPELKEIGKVIEKRLGRKLQPWDIWYDGFKTRASLDISKLDKILQEKYPDKTTFEADLPNILIKFGFDADSARTISSRIIVDPSRGAGHAWGAAMKSDKARLRTRIGTNGMDYKGYNIAIHEFGHNVEQTISLQNVDYYMLNGVPNTSFTEALAFVFQARDLELLGMEQSDEMSKHLAALDNLWSNYEIMGVSLVDINTWKWLYAHPDATAAELKEAVNSISKEIWNKYYAPVFGVKDTPILAVYSHMIDYPLYLSAYPIGQLIEFQFGSHIHGKNFADEVYKAFTQGRLIPQLWMKGAVGTEISALPAIEAARTALNAVRSSAQ